MSVVVSEGVVFVQMTPLGFVASLFSVAMLGALIHAAVGALL